MLNAGKSWSGRERNCAFLNTGDGRFADVSGLSGFDLEVDSRGLALTDWDQDGDLDVWLTNRTAPSLQFLRNDLAGAGSFLTLKLSGRTANRDGIGARVEVLTNRAKPRLVKTLRAGEGYLSQSSKWLHFGLPDGATIETVRVQWPGGNLESFSDLAANQRYVLSEGSGRSKAAPAASRSLVIEDSNAPLPKENSLGRVVAHAPLPLPILPYLDESGAGSSIQPGQTPVVINLWASWCAPCLKELAHWKSDHEALAGMRVLCLNSDDLGSAAPERRRALAPLLAKLDLPFKIGLATDELLESLDVVQRSLVGPQAPLPLPCTFLLDSQLRLLAFYKGPVTPATLAHDLESIARTNPTTHRDQAVPFPGGWIINPIPPDLLAIPEKLLTLGRPTGARSYLDRHLSAEALKKDPDLAAANPLVRVADLYFRISAALGQGERYSEAEAALELAWQYDRGSPQIANWLCKVHKGNGRIDEAIAVYRQAREVNPREETFANGLAWLLATHPDPARRDPGTAVQIADELCQTTGYRNTIALTTLATSYGSAGDFPKAISTAERALDLARQAGDQLSVSLLTDHLQAFKSGKVPLEQ